MNGIIRNYEHNFEVTYCSKCEGTSFEEMIDGKLTGKCCKCKKLYKTKKESKK